MLPATIITNCLVLFLIISSNIVSGEYGSSSSKPLVPALYVFGDSLVDSGNNNLLLTAARANYPPYGHNFADGCTGRFTNGKTVADFAAEFLGLPYPPPYVTGSRSLLHEISLTGYNYASGSCGILPQTGRKYGKCLNLDEQIRLFARTLTTILGPNFKNTLSQHLAKSIFLVVAGSNDYFENYLNDPLSTDDDPSQQRYNNYPQQFVQLLIDLLSQKLQTLYQLGARKVFVSDIGPLGCVPSVGMRHYNPDGKCDENLNKIVLMFNDQLPSMLEHLTSTLQDSHFIPVQTYKIAYDAIFDPNNYGFSDTSNSCCVTSGGLTATCIVGLQPCPDPNTHVFWDQVHPTEALYSLAASHFINKSLPLALL